MDSIKHQQYQGMVTLYHNFSVTTGNLITFDKIKEMATKPARTAKSETALIVPTDAHVKTKEAILQHNNMTISWIDVDDNDISLDEVINSCKAYQITNAICYSTSSAMRIKDGIKQGHKWRVLIPLSHSLCCEHWLILQQALAQVFNACSSAVRVQQGFFAPTNPDGEYYEHVIIEGEVLNADTLTVPLLDIVNRIQAEEQAIQEQAAIAPNVTRQATGANGHIIDMVNAAYPLENVLNSLGYIQKSKNKFLHPRSKSGAAGVVILESRYFSHHECDPLADGHTHDAFDLLTFWNFGGDVAKAVAHYAGELDQEGQRQRRLEHVKAQGMLTPSPSLENTAAAKFGSLFVDGTSLLSANVKIDYIIHNIIESNATGLIFGPSGEAKTFTSDDMGLSVASGLEWNGHATKKGLVICFNGEGFSGKPRRIKAWSKSKGYPDISNFIISKHTVNFETDVQRIVYEIQSIVATKGLSPVLMIVDTLARHLNYFLFLLFLEVTLLFSL